MIDVCCAIILKEERLLAVQRGPQSNHPWQWEFPGGKIHLDETPKDAIVREIEEELMVRIIPGRPLIPIEYTYPFAEIKLIPFLSRIESGEVALTEHVACKWLGLEDIWAVNWAEADRLLIETNLEILGNEMRKNQCQRGKNSRPA